MAGLLGVAVEERDAAARGTTGLVLAVWWMVYMCMWWLRTCRCTWSLCSLLLCQYVGKPDTSVVCTRRNYVCHEHGYGGLTGAWLLAWHVIVRFPVPIHCHILK